jgi:hypothetical protein
LSSFRKPESIFRDVREKQNDPLAGMTESGNGFVAPAQAEIPCFCFDCAREAKSLGPAFAGTTDFQGVSG